MHTCLNMAYFSFYACHTLFNMPDCRENVLLQGVYHPGLFVNGKWSCCEHRSKHSQGCKTSFCGMHQDAPPSGNHVSPTRAAISGNARGPLPPTPVDEVAPSPPPHSSSSRYHETHTSNPNGIQSYEQHDLDSPQDRNGRRGRGGGMNDRSELLPPPVPVSVIGTAAALNRTMYSITGHIGTNPFSSQWNLR